jgi:hypothetical protein
LKLSDATANLLNELNRSEAHYQQFLMNSTSSSASIVSPKNFSTTPSDNMTNSFDNITDFQVNEAKVDHFYI